MNQHTYKYTFVALALAPGVTASPDIKIGQDVAKFTATGMSVLALDATTGVTVSNEQLALILADLKPALDEAGICNVPTPLCLIAGNGKEPHLFDRPIEFEGNSTPVCQLTNISSDKTYKVYVTLHGYREKK